MRIHQLMMTKMMKIKIKNQTKMKMKIKLWFGYDVCFKNKKTNKRYFKSIRVCTTSAKEALLLTIKQIDQTKNVIERIYIV